MRLPGGDERHSGAGRPSPPPPDHDWVEVPMGSDLTDGQGFRFCAVCDRTEYLTGTLFSPGYGDGPCAP